MHSASTIQIVAEGALPEVFDGECDVLEFKARVSDRKIEIRCEHYATNPPLP